LKKLFGGHYRKNLKKKGLPQLQGSWATQKRRGTEDEDGR
jgi:hypothetical protein